VNEQRRNLRDAPMPMIYLAWLNIWTCLWLKSQVFWLEITSATTYSQRES